MAFDPSGASFGPACHFGANYATGAARCFVWSGAPPSPVAPVAGGDIDGVSGHLATIDFGPEPDTTIVHHGWVACPGWPVKVEAAAAFNGGVSLEATSNGRVQAVATGKAVLRSLGVSSGPGSIVWAVFTSGR